MEFQALYYGDRLRIVNSHGDVGIATLWTPPERVLKMLKDLGIDLGIKTSRIAVVANLFGKGLREMLRNLLWNPQIAHLLVLGQDLSGSKEDLVNFFNLGIEETIFFDKPAYRIKDRTRIVDNLVDPTSFRNNFYVVALGKLGDLQTRENLVQFFTKLPPQAPPPKESERRSVPIPRIEVQRFPSEPRSHTIIRDSPLEAWLELIFRLQRFGHWVQLKKGKRRELQNVHVVVAQPYEEPPELLAKYGFSLEGGSESLCGYQRSILDDSMPEVFEQPYTYGHRLRAYFGHDNLTVAVDKLKADPESRHAHLSLWDSGRDLQVPGGVPCLDSIFFRCFEGKLTLTATFRTHNARDAWFKNFYALMAVQRYVAERVDMISGPITVFSRSISLQEEDISDEAFMSIVNSKETDDVINLLTGKRELRIDPNGYFTFTLDRELGEIVVEHGFEGTPLHEYRGASAQAIREQLAGDNAISLISHALYVGEELGKMEMQLKQLTKKRDGE